MALEYACEFGGISVFFERICTPRLFGVCGSRDVDSHSRIWRNDRSVLSWVCRLWKAFVFVSKYVERVDHAWMSSEFRDELSGCCEYSSRECDVVVGVCYVSALEQLALSLFSNMNTNKTQIWELQHTQPQRRGKHNITYRDVAYRTLNQRSNVRFQDPTGTHSNL